MKNSKLKRELDGLTDKCSTLQTSIRTLERQIDQERAAQQNFNLEERTQRMQANYANMRGTMANYYNQIRTSLPLLMLLSGQNDNLGIRALIPALLGGIGDLQNGEQLFANLFNREAGPKRLSDQDFGKLPTKNWRASMKSTNQTFETCPICYIDYEHDIELKVLPCQHAYHTDCLHNWVKKNASCPICKKEIN